MATLEGFTTQAALNTAQTNNDPRLNAGNSQVVNSTTGEPVAPTPPNPLITTGTPSAMEFGQNSNTLNQMLGNIGVGANNQNVNNPDQQTTADMLTTYSDPYTQALDKLSANSDKATQNLIATIKANKSSRETNIQTEYDRLKSGLMSLGLSTDKLKYTPDLVYGGIMQAENQKATQLQDLDQKEATALLDAQNARDNKDFATLKDKIAYLKDIKNQKLDVLKNTYDTANYEQKIGELQANAIYDNLQKLPEAQKLTFLTEVAKKFNIPLMTLQSQVNQVTRDRAKVKTTTKASTGTKNYTAINIPNDISSDLNLTLTNHPEKTLQDFFSAFPEVSTTYLTSLYKSYHPTTSGGSRKP